MTSEYVQITRHTLNEVGELISKILDTVNPPAQESDWAEIRRAAGLLSEMKWAVPAGYTPPPVHGYRTLRQDEVDLVNEIKAAEASYAAVWLKVKGTPGVDQRMVALARTHIEDGGMWLARSVFQPVSPFDEARFSD